MSRYNCATSPESKPERACEECGVDLHQSSWSGFDKVRWGCGWGCSRNSLHCHNVSRELFLWSFALSAAHSFDFTRILKCTRRTTTGVTGNKSWNAGDMFIFAEWHFGCEAPVACSFRAVQHFKSHWSGRRGWNQTLPSLTAHTSVSLQFRQRDFQPYRNLKKAIWKYFLTAIVSSSF